MTDGAIVLGLLATLFAFVIAKARRRAGLGVTTKTLAIAMSGFVIVVLILWATHR